MAGQKGRSGRKKSGSTLVNQALECVDQNIPAIFGALIKRALNGDREAQIYLIDRRLGKPKQDTHVDIEGAMGLMTASQYTELIMNIAKEKIRLESAETPLLKESDAAKQEEKQGENEEV